MFWKSDDYLLAARERIGEANTLRREKSYTLSMYVAGVAAECTLRAYHVENRPFDERHDVVKLYDACNFDRLSEGARRRWRGAIQDMRGLWLNGYRYAHAEMVRTHLHREELDRDVARNADALKVKCTELFDACLEIVTVGVDQWMKR